MSLKYPLTLLWAHHSTQCTTSETLVEREGVWSCARAFPPAKCSKAKCLAAPMPSTWPHLSAWSRTRLALSTCWGFPQATSLDQHVGQSTSTTHSPSSMAMPLVCQGPGTIAHSLGSECWSQHPPVAARHTPQAK